jgi:hypothetical protein
VSCPRCGSDDVRHSHSSFGLDRVGFHRYRCHVCHARFWRSPGRHEDVRAHQGEGLEAPPDADAAPGEPGPVADLSALDAELSRRRAETPPH